METSEELKLKSWWGYLGEDLQELLLTSEFINRATEIPGFDLPGGKDGLNDYSFVIFPAAKAYEGFLKKMFLDLGFITEEDYFGKRFRIGKALNPSLPKELKAESVYNKIVKHCQGRTLADNLWETWRICRNLTFHWFPNEKNAISLSEARDRFQMIINAIDQAFEGCRIISKGQ
jgi:hypothetical protein